MMPRNPIAISDNFVLCEDGTIWRWNKRSSAFYYALEHWEKMIPIPDDEEYQKQCDFHKELYTDYCEKLQRGKLGGKTWTH
jgi:hypothetical protein